MRLKATTTIFQAVRGRSRHPIQDTPHCMTAPLTTRIAVNREITATPDMAVTFPLTKGDLTNIQQATGDIGTFGTETRPRNIAFLYIVRAA